MNRSSLSHYPSVHSFAVVIIFAFCIAANFWPTIKASKEETNNGEIKNSPKVKGYRNIANRFDRNTKKIQITNSRCPTFCECEHVIWDHGTTDGTTEISVFCHEGNLDQKAFSKLLKQIPKEVTVLDVEAPLNRPNHLLWDDNLNQLRYLRVLRLINCAIPAISRALRLPNLEILDLRGNQIHHLPVSIFSGISSIQELNLAKNSLSVLPTGAFAYLKHLQVLSLAYNNITEITANLLHDLKNLKSLEMDGNRISLSQLNNVFADIPQLERLELNECGLSMGAVNDLAFDKFYSLRQLGLAGNMLGKVPISVLRNNLASLISLDLSNNGIVEIEPEVFARSNISRLLLAGNYLGAKSNALSVNSLKTGAILHELDLSRNNFQHFRAENLGVVREMLEILHLNGNHISSIGQWLTANMTKLKILHLGYNFIEYLPPKLPNEFAQLTFLNLSGNQLSSLLEHSREMLPMLRMFDISENRFTSFPVTVIQNFLNSLDKVSFRNELLHFHHLKFWKIILNNVVSENFQHISYYF
uniref:Leucine-rich repeat-containing N-terminal plant-type domain-containing protein n=1 Tax=Setaria digitata TaxID=48799 RepID=A0A915PS48_9BILA